MSSAQPQAPEWQGEADGVFRGGGVKGLALAGALTAFAKHPKWPVKRWVNVAGASAGAIIASYLAFDKSDEVGQHMIDLLDPKKLASFQDFPLGSEFIGGIPRLIFEHGMAPGDKFTEWFDGVLKGSTFSIAIDDVTRKVAADQGKSDWDFSRLKLIAADVTNRRLLVLPEDLPKYRLKGASATIDPAAFPISHAARMSMSIPYFFQPVELERVRDDDGNELAEPVESTIVDGGTLSNFPVWIFDSGTPRRPTFGFTLEGGSGVGGGLTKMTRLMPWAVRFGFDIFHTAQEAWDVRFQTHSTQVRTFASSATVMVDGKPVPVNTTDFDLSKVLQTGLIENGVAAANAFLDKFDMKNYFNTLHATL
jgi:NTE family protein